MVIVPEIHIQALCNQFHCFIYGVTREISWLCNCYCLMDYDKTQNFCVVETAENLYLNLRP